jgi:acetyl esterase/lipase
MTISPIERSIRLVLPIIRFMQTSMPLPLTRWFLRRSIDRVELDTGVRRVSISAHGVPCEWIIPDNCRTDQVLLYLHGGGFVFGLTPPLLQMGAYLAQVLGMRILMVDYRLAPENPYPAALDDCVCVFRWLLKEGIKAQSIVVAGDSAGGNLTITMLMKLRDDGSPLPAAAACISPVTDLTNEGTKRSGVKDPLLSPKAIKLYSRSYIGTHEATDPLISPVYGNLRGLPPLLVHVGEEEILRDDAIRITKLARSADVEARLEIYPRMWHVWQTDLTLPQAVRSLDEIANFLKSHLESIP